VNDARDLADLAFEYAERRRVGEHDARGIRAHCGSQSVDLDVAVRVAGNFLDAAAAHRRGGRVRSVRRLRHDDFSARQVAARSVIAADHRHTGELALRTRHRRQTDALHAGDVLEHVL
jgi:hypothetical protein